MKDLRFGVEIEMVGLRVEQAQHVVTSYVDGAFDHLGRTWSVVPDASIPDGDEFELRTPALSYPDVHVLEDLFRLLRHAGARRSAEVAGVHVHVDARAFSLSQLMNLVFLYSRYERLLYRAFDVHPIRKLRWCQPIEAFAKRLAETRVSSIEELREVWYEDYEAGREALSRYSALNLHSFFVRGTVEFRAFASTNQGEKVRSFVVVSLACANAARQQEYQEFEAPVSAEGLNDALAAVSEMSERLGIDTREHSAVVAAMHENVKRGLRTTGGRRNLVFQSAAQHFDGGSYGELLVEMLDNDFLRLPEIRDFLRGKCSEKATTKLRNESRGEALCRGVLEALEKQGLGRLVTV
jgi:putative amidoligase enzyme